MIPAWLESTPVARHPHHLERVYRDPSKETIQTSEISLDNVTKRDMEMNKADLIQKYNIILR